MVQVTACEICRNKEERRSQLCKKLRTTSFNSEAGHSPETYQSDNVTVEIPTSGLYEAAIASMGQIQTCLQKIQHHETEVVDMSKSAELDIDDMLDYLLAKIMKLISRRKREMKIQVFTHFYKEAWYAALQNNTITPHTILG